MSTAQITKLVLWRDDDEEPTSEILKLDGVTFDTTGSTSPTLVIYKTRPKVTADAAGANVVGTYAGSFVGAMPAGFRVAYTVPRADLDDYQPSWWHRAYLVTAAGKRKTFSRGPVVVEAQ